MAHMWDRGVLNKSSWHGLEEIGDLPNADALILAGETSGAYPVKIAFEAMQTEGGLPVPAKAIRADYAKHDPRVLGVVGDRYQATTPEEWRELIRAACKAGAQPTGAFSLRDGSRVLATFEVGVSNGLRTNLVLADAFDGSLKLHGGSTDIRVVCANTLKAALSESDDWAKIRHTSSLSGKVSLLKDSIGRAIEQGQAIREAFEQASKIKLSNVQAQVVFDALFPPAEFDAGKAGKTRAENDRRDAVNAMANPVNNVGNTLASLWNAATFLVDRKADGSPRPCRGNADMLDSLLFGARGKRLGEIGEIINGAMASVGTIPMIPSMPVAQPVGVN